MTSRHLGKTLHMMPSGKVIARAEFTPDVGTKVYDRMLKQFGRVDDVFGPVSNPYVSIRLSGRKEGIGFNGIDLFVR